MSKQASEGVAKLQRKDELFIYVLCWEYNTLMCQDGFPFSKVRLLCAHFIREVYV